MESVISTLAKQVDPISRREKPLNDAESTLKGERGKGMDAFLCRRKVPQSLRSPSTSSLFFKRRFSVFQRL